jgi:EAL domain-containing protein (putative c-di-GMP-specific phosphodiesterase class I)
MVEAIHRIGRVTGKQTIAESVETIAIRDALAAVGVDYAQGYGIAMPAPFTLPHANVDEAPPSMSRIAAG